MKKERTLDDKTSLNSKVKSFFTYLLFTAATIGMVVFLILNTKSIKVNMLEYDNNEINILFEEMEGMQEYSIEYCDNALFINDEKIKVQCNEAVIKDVDFDKVYVRIKPVRENFVQTVTKIYVLQSHEHTYVRNDELTVKPQCSKDGWFVDECLECDSMKAISIPKLGCNKRVVGYKATSCTEDGHTVLRCERCGEFEKNVSPKVDHAYAYTETLKKSSCVEQGQAKYNCIGCNDEKIETLAYTAHSYSYNGEFNNGSSVGVSLKCSYCSKDSSKTFGIQGLGSYQGTIYIPSVGITVPVYLGPVGATQPVCDAVNSASMQRYGYGVKTIIADHYYQGGFTNIRRAIPGSTVMYFAGQKYICSENSNGYNNKRDLCFSNGVPITSGGSQLYLYTCNDNSGYSIRIVGWNRA